MIAWLIKLTDFLPVSSFSVRLMPVLLSHALIIIWFRIWTLLNFSKEKFWWFFWLVLLSPLLGFGGIAATPDVPVLFFWSLATLSAIKVTLSHKSQDYIVLGAALGLGFCSKYHIVLFPLFFVLFLLFEKKRDELLKPKVLLTVATGLIASLPVLWWNYENGWISFLFQLKHGFVRPEYKVEWTLTYLLGQIAVLFPTVVYCFTRANLQSHQRLLVYLAIGPLFFFFLSSFKALVEINWPIIAYPAFLAIATVGAKTIRPLLISMLFWCVIFLGLVFAIHSPSLPLPGDSRQKILEFSEFQTVADARQTYSPLYATTYQMASWVWFKTKNPMYKLRGMSRVDFYDFMPESWPSAPTFYVAARDSQTLPDWLPQHGYTSLVVEKRPHGIVIWKVEKK